MNTYWPKGLSPNERLYENKIQHPYGMKKKIIIKNIMRYTAQAEKKRGQGDNNKKTKFTRSFKIFPV